jgi:ABC-2 type transport system permease protein
VDDVVSAPEPRPTWPPRVVAAVVAANLARLARDRVGLAFIVAVPFLLILVIGVSSATNAAEGRPVGLVAPDDPGGAAARLVGLLEGAPTLEPVRFEDVPELRSAVRRGMVAAGIEIPADLQARLDAGEPAPVRFHTDPSGLPPSSVRTAAAQAVAQAGATLRSARVVAERTGITPAAARAAADAMPSFGATEVEERVVGTADARLPSGFAYTAPAYLVLFVFINTLVAAWGLPADRARGLLRRAFAAPTGAAAVLLGEWLSRLLVALLQAGLIVVVGALLFGVDWGDPVAVAAVVLLFALAATGASILLGTLARTSEQVTAIAPPVGIALGMLGGCMWPLEIVGPTLRTIGHATPHAWAVDALFAVVATGAGLTDLGRELAALGAFAAGFLLVALLAFGRVLRSAHG